MTINLYSINLLMRFCYVHLGPHQSTTPKRQSLPDITDDTIANVIYILKNKLFLSNKLFLISFTS